MNATHRFQKSRRWIFIYRVPLLLALLFLLLTSPIIFYLIQLRLYEDIVWRVLFTISVFLIPFYFFRNHLKLYVLLPAIFILFTPIALFLIFEFKIIFKDSIMILVYNTNREEAWEFLSPYLFAIIICFISITLLIVLIYRLLPRRIPPQKALFTSSIAFFSFLIIPAINLGTTHYLRNLKSPLYSYYPFYLAYYGHKFYKDIKDINSYKNIVKTYDFHAYKKDSLKQRQIYILVIGETGRHDHWGINGYYRNTSPLLSHVKSLISFKDDITAGSYTTVSVPIIISRATPRNFNLDWKEKSIVSVFKEAGFETYWISDQFYGDDLGLISIHLHEADHLVVLHGTIMNDEKSHLDMELADSLQKFVDHGPSKMFIVIHTMGSHFEYTKRYPPKFNVFRPSGEGKNLSPSDPRNKTMLINGYDNAILYTDAVLDSVISILNQKDVVGSMLYVADHGENLMDDSRGLFLHPPFPVSKYVAHVPLFIFTTNSYNERYPPKIMNLKDHINSKVSSDDVFSTLCGMADIDFPGWDSTRCISSEYFQERPRYIRTGVGIGDVVKYSDIH